MILKNNLKPWLQNLLTSFLSVLPIVLVVLVLYFSGRDSNFCLSKDLGDNGYPNELISFLICSLVVAFGLGLFSIGVEQSLSHIGNIIGGHLTKKQNMWLFVILTFVIGCLITIAEPDLVILANETGMNQLVLILTICVGVGLFLVLGTLRIIFQVDLSLVFLAVYGLAFIITNLAAPGLIPLAFDAGGVATGPVTIPFILAFGAGVAASREGSHSGSDDFGLSALATVGPIIAILMLAVFYSSSKISYEVPSIVLKFNPALYGASFSSSLWNVFLGVGPVALFFIIYDLVFLHLGKKDLIKIFVGLIFCYVGLVLFLGAVQIGFSSVAQSIGNSLGNSSGLPLAILIGAVFGCFAVLAEPAVGVLVTQIQTVSEGTIKKSGFLTINAISIAVAVALSVIRAYYQFSIMWYFVPGYILALGLTFLVPKIYSSIAFDAGTVASGPMATSFTMPFIIGFAYACYESAGLSDAALKNAVYEDAFGVISMISLMPLIVVQLAGLYAGIKRNVIYSKARKRILEPDDDQIIHFGGEGVS
jgi:hypothetical protein